MCLPSSKNQFPMAGNHGGSHKGEELEGYKWKKTPHEFLVPHFDNQIETQHFASSNQYSLLSSPNTSSTGLESLSTDQMKWSFKPLQKVSL